ncbi:glycerophosphodiester phosphodiesterase family protein [Glutamicibacter sp. HZAU]|mgnify:FL=1|uniref:glycerophosphodiester phosphodiesterase family protein n=1 Tax=Glutamicibacter sp. HZAU TaxID=2049891 RepID=UPI000FFBD62D|nr:glycerophosphodiester phosphodiesterase family protein [Glutamicibacter sp. HZAU]RWZ82933.1 glycerophosphodiester phosphodiesterase [Glutamicibacter sp. HZAU]
MTYAFSHRGVRTGNEENTLLAFQRAAELGITHFESDVHASADGTVYLFHDHTLDRVTDASGNFNGFTDAQLAEVRAGGQPLCTLDELLDAFGHATLNLDVKDEHVIGPLAELIERRKAHGQIALASFSSARSAAVGHLLSAPIRRSPGQREIVAIWLCAHLLGWVPKRLLAGYWAVQVPLKQGILPVATRRFIKAVHRAGAQVHVWVIDDEPTMRLLMDRKADAIMSDDAALLVRVLGS